MCGLYTQNVMSSLTEQLTYSVHFVFDYTHKNGFTICQQVEIDLHGVNQHNQLSRFRV